MLFHYNARKAEYDKMFHVLRENFGHCELVAIHEGNVIDENHLRLIMLGINFTSFLIDSYHL